MTITLGVSLKTYFGYAETLAWIRDVAAAVGTRPRSTAELFVLPTFPALPAVAEILAGTGIAHGAQDLAADDAGDQTGEVTGGVLVELGCRYVEVGHAERRTRCGETEDVVAAKTTAALRHGLVPVLCLGEAEHVSVEAAVAECTRHLTSAVAPCRGGGPTGRLVPTSRTGQSEPPSRPATTTSWA